MGAGVLPVTILEGEPFLLFSRESRGSKRRDAGYYSSFGGSTEHGESKLTTASREFAEESSGMLTPSGTEASMETKIKEAKKMIQENCVAIISTNCYTEYIVEIPYDHTLIQKFRLYYEKIKLQSPELLRIDGMFEKDRLQWVKASNLSGRTKYITETSPDNIGKKFWFRPWYWSTGIPKRSARVVMQWAQQKRRNKTFEKGQKNLQKQQQQRQQLS